MKRGFTLIELLGVIIILCLLFVLVLPKMTTLVKTKEKDIDKATENIIINAAKLYVSEREETLKKGQVYCITLSEMVDLGFLKSPIKSTSSNIDLTNTKSVQVAYNNGYEYKILDKSTCQPFIDTAVYLASKGYQQVEYVESTGTQYIDTAFLPNQDSKMFLDYQPTSAQSKIYAGCRGTKTSTESKFFTINSGNAATLMYGSYGNSGNITLANMSTSRVQTTIGKDGLYFNGVLKYTPTYTKWQQTQSIYLFAVHQLETADLYSNVKIYSCKIWSGDEMVRDFIPCYKKSDNQIGMYDMVNDVFYVNSGSGTFLKGANVNENIIVK